MKKLIVILTLTIAGQAFATGEFFECSGISGVEEYRVGINMKTNKAAFFDSDSTSYMALTKIELLETLPPQKQYVFEGKSANSLEDFRLFFNFNRKSVSLYSTDSKGETSEVGSALCVTANPWDDLN